MAKKRPPSYKEGQYVCCFFRNLKEYQDAVQILRKIVFFNPYPYPKKYQGVIWILGKIISLDPQGKSAIVALAVEQEWQPKMSGGDVSEWSCEDQSFVVRQQFSGEMVLLNRIAARRFPEINEKVSYKTTIATEHLCPARYLDFRKRLVSQKDV